MVRAVVDDELLVDECVGASDGDVLCVLNGHVNGGVDFP